MSSSRALRPAPLAGFALPVRVVADERAAARAVAAEIAALLAERPDATLGLATGRTPLALYDELARLHHEGALSFARATSFNLDEYHGLAPEHPASFHAVMRSALFDRIDLPRERAHVPDGRVPLDEVERYCTEYERAIRDAGGIDLQILGIGRNAHLAFNEPGSPRESRTRLVRLAPETRRANAASFAPGEAVPERAITMGIATILEARALRVMAFGAEKGEIVRRALLEPVDPRLPASFLREHPDVELWLDQAAAARVVRA